MADIYDKIEGQAIDRIKDHAYEGHVNPKTARRSVNEFTHPHYGRNLGIEEVDDLANLAHKTLNDPRTMGFFRTSSGSHAYFYNDADNVLVIIGDNGKGSIYRPYLKFEYVEELLDRAKGILKDDFIHVTSGGIDALRNAYIEHFGRHPEMLPLHEAARAFKTVAFETGEALSQKAGLKLFADLAPRIGGRALKFIPLAGTAATFMIGRAEAAELREAAHDAVAEGLLPAEALEDYEKVLFAHQVQVNLDFSMVGMEDDVQEGFDKFADFYELDDETRERLEPPSLIEDVSGMKLDDNTVVIASLSQSPTAAP